MQAQEQTWIGKILTDRRQSSDTTYAEKRLQLAQLLEKTENLDFEKVFTTLGHVLVLAVDRLDYDTLHLTWLPQLKQVSELIGKASIDIQFLSNLFCLFLGIDESEGLVSSLYGREANNARLVEIRQRKFMAPPSAGSSDADYFKVIESLVCLTWCQHDGYDTFFDSRAFTLAVQAFKDKKLRFVHYAAQFKDDLE